ncbi:MAG TPA: hypothetical protein VJH55_01860 [Candidatus Paceibacterota bacterium]
MKKFILIIALLLLSTTVANAPVSADSYQAPQHSYAIVVDKLVAYPTDSNGTTDYNYVDNLGSSDFKFSPNGYIFFKIKVKNTSDVNLDTVVLKDFAPSYVDVFTTEIAVGTLQPQEQKEYIIQARVKGADSVPAGMTCVTNRAQASNSQASDEDTAGFCIEKNVVVTPPTIPATGPEFGLGLTALSASLGFLGMKLRKL